MRTVAVPRSGKVNRQPIVTTTNLILPQHHLNVTPLTLLSARFFFARSALYVDTGKSNPWKSCSSITPENNHFCEEDLRVGTGPVRLGSLKHDFEAAPKMTCL